MGMEQNNEPQESNERINNAPETVERAASERLADEAHSPLQRSEQSASKTGENSAKELDFTTGKAIERQDATPKQIAENIAKNGTFGKNDQRFDTEMTLNKAMKDGKAKEVVDQINKELEAAGSKHRVDVNVSGGGGASADRMVNGVRTSTRSSESHGEFTVRGEHGQTDRMALSRGSTERIENGKVVGERTWSQGENGGSAGAWGKAPMERAKNSNPYPLNSLILDGYNGQSSATAFGQRGSTLDKQIPTDRRKK